MQFLTPQEKQKIIRRWDRLRKDYLPNNSEVGSPDPDVFPLCDALNSLTGICTLQSCSGHGSGAYIEYPGHIWLRVNRHVSGKFNEQAYTLATSTDIIDRVMKIYGDDGKETIVIEFAGNERGRLTESIMFITEFFTELVAD